ncbi:MAG: hypothetical protein JZD41_02080 [Thermoproteus sp.]|nr:hypothetical protein [Thermoproteus sp.]
MFSVAVPTEGTRDSLAVTMARFASCNVLTDFVDQVVVASKRDLSPSILRAIEMLEKGGIKVDVYTSHEEGFATPRLRVKALELSRHNDVFIFDDDVGFSITDVISLYQRWRMRKPNIVAMTMSVAYVDLGQSVTKITSRFHDSFGCFTPFGGNAVITCSFIDKQKYLEYLAPILNKWGKALNEDIIPLMYMYKIGFDVKYCPHPCWHLKWPYRTHDDIVYALKWGATPLDRYVANALDMGVFIRPEEYLDLAY